MAKVLVTGASGFIGMHLTTALQQRSDEVACLVRKSSRVDRLPASGVRLVYGDVTDHESLRSAVAGQDVVYHIAGCVLALTARQFYQVNHRGVANMAQACAEQATPPVLVTVSSLAAAGPTLDGRPKTEADPPKPVSHYGHSKRAGERAASRFADRVPITVVRPPIVLGEADAMGLPLFRSIAQLGVHLVPGWKNPRFSLIHAADLVELLILAAERGRRLPPRESSATPGQGVYFAACEEHPTYADLGRIVSRALGRRRVLVIPMATPIVRTVAATGELIGQVRRRPPYMNCDKLREITAGNWVCSAQAAEKELGFRVGAPILERLRQTADWYRHERWL